MVGKDWGKTNVNVATQKAKSSEAKRRIGRKPLDRVITPEDQEKSVCTRGKRIKLRYLAQKRGKNCKD